MKEPVAEKAARKQRGKPFKPGQSGNPAGKPKGARNAATVAMEALLDNESDALTRKAIELATRTTLPAVVSIFFSNITRTSPLRTVKAA
jgi:Family of unknown function (DUF5681)